MSNPSTLAHRQKTEDIHPDRWIPFLAEFTRENRGAHARLEVIGANTDVGDSVETENRPFDGVAADVKDRERTVWLYFGSSAENRLAHSIPNATVIRALPATETTGAVLEVETSDHTKTILELTEPEAFSLPNA